MYADHGLQHDRNVYDVCEFAMRDVQLRHLFEQRDPGLVPVVYGHRRLHERADVYALDELAMHHVRGGFVPRQLHG